MRNQRTKVTILLVLLLLSVGPLPAQETGVDPRADQILREMSAYLGGLKEFAFLADVTLEEEVSGALVELGNRLDVCVRRPDGIWASRRGDSGHQEAYFDGKTLTIADPDKGYYAQSTTPPDIESALDFAHEKLGVTMPMADLLFSNSHGALTADTQAGFYAGEHPIRGIPCHHLVFVQNSGLEWQMWIEKGRMMVPRKFVIRQPQEAGSGRYEAIFSDWQIDALLPNRLFTYEAPVEAKKIDFAGRKQ